MLMWMFRNLGILLHDRANRLGILVQYSEANDIKAQESFENAKNEEFIRELHKLSVAQKYKDAWNLLSARIKQDGYTSEAFLFNRLRKLQDPYLGQRIGQDHIERLISNREFTEAWHVYDICTATPKIAFRLLSGRAGLRLAETADSSTRSACIVQELDQFEKNFPNHPAITDALLLAAQINCNQSSDFDKARRIIGELELRFPAIQGNGGFRATRTILDKATDQATRN